MLKITPVFKAPWYEEKSRWPWPIAAVDPFSFIPISRDPDDATIGSFFAGFAPQSDPPDDRSATVQLEDILEHGAQYADGGMTFEADGITIYPGCCADLGMIVELVEFFTTGAGHNPAPWATLDGSDITIWSDGGLDDKCIEPCIRTSREEFEAQLSSACVTLAAFGQACQEWLINHEIPRADEIHSRITLDFEELTEQRGSKDLRGD